jgi:hypothetical protein
MVLVSQRKVLPPETARICTKMIGQELDALLPLAESIGCVPTWGGAG